MEAKAELHPFADLSAYLDGALDQSARAALESHLATCVVCRARLGELRGTASLIARLPSPAPAHSLVPRISVPIWLAPIRTLSVLASGAAVFLFVASAVVAGLPIAQSGGTTAAPAAAPRPEAASGPAIDQATRSIAAPGASPSPGAQFGLAAPSATPALTEQRSAESDAAKARQDQATGATGAAGPAGPIELERTQLTYGSPSRPQLGPSPWFWLALAVGFGALALVLQRRLRRA